MIKVFVSRNGESIVVRTMNDANDTHVHGFRVLAAKDELFGRPAAYVPDGAYDEEGNPLTVDDLLGS